MSHSHAESCGQPFPGFCPNVNVVLISTESPSGYKIIYYKMGGIFMYDLWSAPEAAGLECQW